MSYVTPDYLTQYHENLIKSFNIKYKTKIRGISPYHSRKKHLRMHGDVPRLMLKARPG